MTGQVTSVNCLQQLMLSILDVFYPRTAVDTKTAPEATRDTQKFKGMTKVTYMIIDKDCYIIP